MYMYNCNVNLLHNSTKLHNSDKEYLTGFYKGNHHVNITQLMMAVMDVDLLLGIEQALMLHFDNIVACMLL